MVWKIISALYLALILYFLVRVLLYNGYIGFVVIAVLVVIGLVAANKRE